MLGGKPAPAAAAAGTAALGSYGSVEIDLNGYFTDTKTPTLSYKATSSDKKIVSLSANATTNVVAGGKLTVTAAGVGTATSAMATITVEAYDGANAAKTSSFDVVVVTSNNPPSFTGVDPIDDLVDKIRRHWCFSMLQQQSITSCTCRLERSSASSRRPSIQGPRARQR